MPQILCCHTPADFRSLVANPLAHVIAKFPLLFLDKVTRNILSSATECQKTYRNLVIFKSFTLPNVTAVGQWFENVQRDWQVWGRDFSHSIRKQPEAILSSHFEDSDFVVCDRPQSYKGLIGAPVQSLQTTYSSLTH